MNRDTQTESTTPRRLGLEPGSWQLVLPALKAALLAVFGGLTDGFVHYFRPENWSASDEFVTVDDEEAAVHVSLRKGSSARRKSGSHLGIIAWPLRFNLHADDIGPVEVWTRLAMAGLLPTPCAGRSFGPAGTSIMPRRGDAILFASLGLPAIEHVEVLVARAGFARWRWSVERPTTPAAAWTKTEGETALVRELEALGLSVRIDPADRPHPERNVVVVCIPPAGRLPARGPQSELRLRDRKCPDPNYWRNRFALSYRPATFTAGPRNADGSPAEHAEGGA